MQIKLSFLCLTLCGLELLLARTLDVSAVPISVFCHMIPSFLLALVYLKRVNYSRALQVIVLFSQKKVNLLVIFVKTIQEVLGFVVINSIHQISY